MAWHGRFLVAGLAVVSASFARAQTTEPNPTSPPETIEVIGVTPLPGANIDRDKVPANVQTLTASDLAREGPASLIDGLGDRAGSVNMNANLGDPFQPDVLYRGFEASPVLGTPQGLAVYQNGVRINEAFGDTVNWDLIPDIAIDRIDLFSANPVYGLNALGGALAVTMKNGFNYQGFDGELAGGSFGQRSGAFEYGVQSGNLAAYLAGRAFDEDGWRQFSPDHVKQLYADVGARFGRFAVDLSFSGADNHLFGEGTTPEQELAVSRALDFTTPQNNFNELEFVALNGSYQATDTLTFQTNAYRRQFRQTVLNGNTTNYTACMSGNGLLCQSDEQTPLVSASGGSIPDLSNGGAIPIGENDRETIRSVSVGGTLQANYAEAIFGHENHLALGGSIDHADVDFVSTAEIGVINSSLQVLDSGFYVNTPENSGFNATPIHLGAADDYYGIFLTDTFNVTPALALTASGRYNLAEISLTDHLGANLSGDSRYSRFNPAIGGTYKILTSLTAYAGYSEGNRVPSPSEIECSNPAQPCLLPSSLSSDPPTLKQVVSHTYEAGLRGRLAVGPNGGRLTGNLGLFRTDIDDDIYGVATSISSGFFENIGSTRRQGIEAGLAYSGAAWTFYGSYSLVDATFQSPFTLPSPSNPFADANGNIQVQPGNRLPGIPQHQLKLGADFHINPRWRVGGVLTYNSDQYLRGDESNQNPPVPGYVVVNLHSAYRISDSFEIFADLRNAFNTRYATFGAFGDPTGVGAPGIPADAVTNGPGVDNRFLGPGAPISVIGGIRIRF